MTRFAGLADREELFFLSGCFQKYWNDGMDDVCWDLSRLAGDPARLGESGYVNAARLGESGFGNVA